MVYFSRKGMKTIARKTGMEKLNVNKISLYTRAKVGTHLGMILKEGIRNSIIIGITHSDKIVNDISTIQCNFASLTTKTEESDITRIMKESRAILTIVDNNTMQNKNQKILSSLRYKTGLIHKCDQELLKEKVLLEKKITYLSNEFNSKNTYILYQTETKIDAVSIKNKSRLIELIGYEAYDECIQPLVNLSYELGDQRLSVADILKDKINNDGIEGVMSFIKKIG